MPWHLMYLTEETRDGQTFDESSVPEWFAGEDARGEIVAGYALLKGPEYERWKEDRYAYQKLSGYVLTEEGSWRPTDELACLDMDSAHRILRRLPRAVITSMDWEESLQVHDIDRYFDHYGELDKVSIRFFEKHLRYDPDTVRVLEGLRALEELHGDAEELTEYAYVPAFFHRAAEVVGTYRRRSLEQPSNIPGPLDEDTQSVLLGYHSASLTRKLCEVDEQRGAAALLAVLSAWTRGKRTPSWAARMIEKLLDQEIYWEDWQEAFDKIEASGN